MRKLRQGSTRAYPRVAAPADAPPRARHRVLLAPVVPLLTGVPVPFAALRVAAEPAHPDRLRAYACLTEETDDV